MDDAGWKAFQVVMGVALTLGAFIASRLWAKVDSLGSSLHALELRQVQVNVTREELKEVLREALAPVNRDLRAIIRALEAQSIHVPRSE